MLINEVCKICKLTKKAVEYYEEQKLIYPGILENGYRDFSEKDVERLKKIAILRRLELPVSEIQEIITDSDGTLLRKAAVKKSLQAAALKRQQELTEKLATEYDWEYVDRQLEAMEKKQAIQERLINHFPGYYGRYIGLYFGSYLEEPAVTEEQQEAFETILAFLDGVEFHLPADLQKDLDETVQNMDETFVTGLRAHYEEVIRDTEGYISEHREVLEQYISYKKSNEFKDSAAYRFREYFQEFQNKSGYLDIFIPAMKKLSQAYEDYCIRMEEVSRILLEQFPGADL